MGKVRESGVREGKIGRFAMLMAMVLALAVLAGVVGCSGGSSGGGSASEAAATQETPDFVGAWDATSFTLDGKKYDEKAIAELQKNGLEFFMNINEDETWLLCFGNETNTVKGTWAQSGDGNLTLTNGSGAVSAFAIDGDAAQWGSDISFKKAASTPKTPPAAAASSSSAASSAGAGDAASESAAASEEPASSDSGESAESGNSSNSGEVSPDVKEALDSYEAFIDEYVAFMQEYKDSGNAVGMLSDYTSFLQRYTDFAQKIDAMDTSDMSTADYAYYIEVTSRVSQKLLGVL